jgi:N-acylneuraminate cytidylyltransferase
MKKIAIIPARGGSKRIPGKNIRDFLGKPVIAYSIEAAQKAGVFDEIMVSTDDEKIAETAAKYGAHVPFLRSSKNSDDFATTADVLIEVLEKYRSQKNTDFDFGCCIYPAAPLIKPSHLKKGFEMMVPGVPVVLPVVAYDYPPWRGLKLDEKGKAEMMWPEYELSRSQDLPALYHDCGQWYWFETSSFLKTKKLLRKGMQAIIVGDLEVQDIDTETDWKLAELKYKLLNG